MDKVEKELFQQISEIIEESKHTIAVSVNATMTVRNWRVGKLVKQSILQGERSEYGKQIIQSVAQKLSLKFGNTWNDKMLWHCSRFFSTFPDEQIVAALRRELTWTHLRTIIYIDDPLKRAFYL